MIVEACECGGLPPHEHPARIELVDGVLCPRYVEDEYRFWVDWRAVARTLMIEQEAE